MVCKVYKLEGVAANSKKGAGVEGTAVAEEWGTEIEGGLRLKRRERLT